MDSLRYTTGTDGSYDTITVWSKSNQFRITLRENYGAGICRLYPDSVTQTQAANQLYAADQPNNLFDVYYGTGYLYNGTGVLTVQEQSPARVIIKQERSIAANVPVTVTYTIWGNGKIAIKANVYNNTGSAISGQTLGFYVFQNDPTASLNNGARQWYLLANSATGKIDPAFIPYDTAGLPTVDEGVTHARGYKTTAFALAAGLNRQWQFNLDIGHKLWNSITCSTFVNQYSADYKTPDSIAFLNGTNAFEKAWEHNAAGQWQFDENNGTTAYDFSGNGNGRNGTLTNATWYATGKYGSAVSLDGTGDYVTVGNNSAWSLNRRNATIMCWVNTKNTTQTANAKFMEHATSSPDSGWWLGMSSDGLKVRAEGYTPVSSNNMILESTTSIKDNSWHHVALELNHPTATLYIDGKEADARLFYDNQISNPAQPLTLGGATSFNGYLDDIRIYHEVLGDDNLMAIMRGGFDAGKGQYIVRANNDNRLVIYMHGSATRRIQPSFTLDNWWSNTPPQYVYLDGVSLTSGSDYLATVNAANKRLVIQLNKVLTTSSHQIFIDDDDATGAGKVAMKKMYYASAGTDSTWVKNFGGTNLGAATSGEWAFVINSSAAGGTRLAEQFKTAVKDPLAAYSTSATASALNYLDAVKFSLTTTVVDERTNITAWTDAASYLENNTTRLVYDSHWKTASNGGKTFKIRRKITAYPTGRIFFKDSIADISAAPDAGTGSRNYIYASTTTAALPAASDPSVLSAATTSSTDSIRYRVAEASQQSFCFGSLGRKDESGTFTKDYHGGVKIMSTGAGPKEVCGIFDPAKFTATTGKYAVVYMYDFSVPTGVSKVKSDSLVTDVQFPDALDFTNGGTGGVGSSYTTAEGDLNGDGFNESEGCYEVTATGNKVHFTIDCPPGIGMKRYYPVFKFRSYTAEYKPAFVMVDSIPQSEGYDYNVYFDDANNICVYQFNFVKSSAVIYICADQNLAVKLDDFSASGGDKLDTLFWRTQSEEDNAGFNIYRRIKPGWWKAKVRSIQKGFVLGDPAADAVTFKDRYNNDTLWQIVNMKGLIPGAKAGRSVGTRNYIYYDIRVENGITYEYALEDVNMFNEKTRDKRIAEATPGKFIPRVFALYPNFPNPFNPVTIIKYDLPIDCRVDISIYNIRGQKIINLVRTDKIQEAGRYQIQWQGKDWLNRPVATGVYFYSMNAAKFVKIRKMMMVK
jgi:hypothetical protein